MMGVKARTPIIEVVLTNYDALRRPFRNELTVEPVDFGGKHYFLATCNIELLSETLEDMRWRCLSEASQQQKRRSTMWDGSGLEAQAVVGRRISVDGLGVGVCLSVRPARFGGGSAYTLALDDHPGKTTDKRLLSGGSGSVFRVQDEQQPGTPWRWSHDPVHPALEQGEVGNLTDEQSAAVTRLREAAGLNEGQMDTRAALRFLRARDFDVAAAKEQWTTMLAWRARELIDNLCRADSFEPPQVCDTVLRLQSLYPHCMCGYDRGGRPVRIECMGRVEVAELYKHCTEEEICRYHVWQQEEVMSRFLPACFQRTGQEHDQVTVVMDMTSARLRDLTRADARLHIKNFITTLSNYYPETLHRMVIINAPSVLSMAWDFVSPMVDEATKAKIKIAPPGLRTHCVLHELIHPSQLPRFLGGERLTPLDLLLPVVDRGGSLDEVTASVNGWDGYWGMQLDAAGRETSRSFQYDFERQGSAGESTTTAASVSASASASREMSMLGQREKATAPGKIDATRDHATRPTNGVQAPSKEERLALLMDPVWTYTSLGLKR
eukprot:COSAG02_NODE_1985_length_10186_cov_5.320214_2_plen_551_part_00